MARAFPFAKMKLKQACYFSTADITIQWYQIKSAIT